MAEKLTWAMRRRGLVVGAGVIGAWTVAWGSRPRGEDLPRGGIASNSTNGEPANVARVAFPAGAFGPTALAAAQEEAAAALRRDGCVILCSAGGRGLLSEEEQGSGSAGVLLPSKQAAAASLGDLLMRVESVGLDRRSEFEFVEIYHRSPLRYDVSTSSAEIGSGTSHLVSPGLSAALDSLVVPVIAGAFVDEKCLGGSSGKVEGALAKVKTMCDGVVTSLPGAPAQQFHSDGPRGFVTAFVPLVDCDYTGTEFWLGSHDISTAGLLVACGALDAGGFESGSTKVEVGGRGALARLIRAGLAPPPSAFARPRLRRGDVLIFDYAIIHRGRAHPPPGELGGEFQRPVLYRTYNWGGAAEGLHEGPGGELPPLLLPSPLPVAHARG